MPGVVEEGEQCNGSSAGGKVRCIKGVGPGGRGTGDRKEDCTRQVPDTGEQYPIQWGSKPGKSNSIINQQGILRYYQQQERERSGISHHKTKTRHPYQERDTDEQ